jgi:hypothetical protein
MRDTDTSTPRFEWCIIGDNPMAGGQEISHFQAVADFWKPSESLKTITG